VAQNASFDNRFLTTEFRRLGFEFERKTLCTVELSKKLIPDLNSYNWGYMQNAWNSLTDRHRADGDAITTVQLLNFY
jgi:DNA polymerase-3 subunit epsilon